MNNGGYAVTEQEGKLVRGEMKEQINEKPRHVMPGLSVTSDLGRVYFSKTIFRTEMNVPA